MGGSKKWFLCVVAILTATAPWSWAGFAGTDVFLPSVGAGTGSGTSVWYTTVWVHNPGEVAAEVQFTFLLRDQPNVGSSWVYNDRIPAGDTRRYPNALATLFGITSRMFGAIRVQASDRVIVNGRIYSKEQGKEERDSTGQFFFAVPASFAIGAEESTTLLGVYQTNPQADSDYRYNFGFVEVAGNDATVEVTAVNDQGESVQTKNYSLRALEPRQFNVSDLGGNINSTNLRLRVSVLEGSLGKVVAFGSGIANRSNDPSTFEMSFKDGLLADSGSGGGELTLPYEGSTSVGGPAFKVSSTQASADQETAYGGYFVASGAEDIGVYGESTWASGSGDGGSFRTSSAHGAGVRGVAASTSGDAAGVYGLAYGGSGTGVYGENTATGGVGVRGKGAWVGVRGEGGMIGLRGTTSAGESGVWGEHTASSNQGWLGTPHYGVEGHANSNVTNDSGVYGLSRYGTTNGVFGETVSDSKAATGVFGYHNRVQASGAGVWGRTISVYGYAGVFENRGGGGALKVLTTGDGSFMIAGHDDGTGVVSDWEFLLRGDGSVFADGSFNCGQTSGCFNTGIGADLAERIEVAESLEPGDVVEIDPEDTNRFRRALGPSSRLVAGVVSTQPAMTMNNNDLADNDSGKRTDTRPLLALVGQVPVRATAEGGAIRVGDLLVSSSTPGHAMRCAEVTACAGAIIGKALEPLEAGSGRINMLVTLQ